MSQFIEMFGNPLASVQKYPIRSLFDCCEINPRRPLLNILDSDLVSFVPMASVNENGFLQDLVDEEYGKIKKGFTYFENNDVLFAKITPCMENGKGAIAHSLTNGIGMGSTEFHVLRPIKNISNPYWLLCLTRMPIFRDMAAKNMSGTGGQKRVGSEYMSNFKVGLPPIDLQIKFAELYKQADKSKFIGFKSQFIEMFGNPNRNTKGFNQYAISDIFDLQMGKTPERDNQNYWNKGVNIWISISDMQDDCKYVGDSKEYITDMAVSESGIKIIPQGTLLMSFKLTIGRVAIADKDIYTNEAIMAFKDKCVVELSQQWLYNLLTQYDWLGNASQAAKGKTLNKEIIGRSIVSIPPIEMQEEFATIVQQADKSKYIN